MKRNIKLFFEQHPGLSIKAKEIAKKLNLLADYEYTALKELLFELTEEGFILREGKRYMLNRTESKQIRGIVQLSSDGFGFVICENCKYGDIFVSSRNLGGAQEGDFVEVLLFKKQNKNRKNFEGQITDVLKRKADIAEEQKDAGTEKKRVGKTPKGIPAIKQMNREQEIEFIANEFSIPYIFPERVIGEAEAIPLKLSPKEIKQRTDYRDKNVFTIDPEDAKDFDDALSIEMLENGNYSIGIHIADVSHYVKEKGALDAEAEKRGNSVYLVGGVIPMIPERLSNTICSLVPNEPRLTYSVIAELTPRGKLIGYKIEKTIIQSKRRFTYEEAQSVIETGKGDLAEDVLKLQKMALILKKKRLKEGSVNFFTPEVKFVLNEKYHPVDIIKKIQKESNNLVEEFMLLANQIVAKHVGFSTKRDEIKTFLYRIHDYPDTEKLKEFVRFVKSLGYNLSISEAKQPNGLNKMMESAHGTEEEVVINELAIRCMAKAIYSTDNIGHFGLGFDYYTHFTSPIRRYSDLLVHRYLNHYLTKESKLSISKNDLEKICEHISATERLAAEAERRSVKLKQIEFLQDHLGNEYHAIITGVTRFGIFVEITDYLAEGLIHVRDLEGDFYVYDEEKYSLIGRRNKKVFRLGDKIQVKLIRVDYDKSEIDFLVVDE